MKKKKSTAANPMWGGSAATKREIRRWSAREAARYIRSAVQVSYRAGIAAKDSDQRHEATKRAERYWLKAGEAITFGSAFGPLITSSASLSDNVAKFLDTVTK